MGRATGIAFAIGALMSIGGLSRATAQPLLTEATEKAEIVVESVARGLNRPWGLAFLPDGRMLVTEKAGRLRIVTPDEFTTWVEEARRNNLTVTLQFQTFVAQVRGSYEDVLDGGNGLLPTRHVLEFHANDGDSATITVPSGFPITLV